MGNLFSRSKFADKLGLTPPRISQMQADKGANGIAPPTIKFDDKTLAWPAAYVESVAAQRSGRRVSGSIYGFLPPAEPAPLENVALKEVKGKWCFAQKFVTDSGSIVIAMLLGEQVENKWPGLSPHPAKSTYVDSELMIELLTSVSDELLDGDLFATSWVWIDPSKTSNSRVQEVVIIDDNDQSPRDRFGDHRRGLVYRTEFNELTYEVLAGKLGRPVPVFPSSLATPEVVERWLAGGRVSPVEVLIDANWFEQKAAAASLIRHMPERSLSSHQRNVLCGALNSGIRWEESGELDEHIPEYDFWPEPLTGVQLHAVVRQPNFARFQEAMAGTFIDTDSVSDEEGQELIDVISDLLENRFGKYGETPDISLATALSVARSILKNKLQLRPPYGSFANKQYTDFRSFKPSQSKYWDQYCKGLQKLNGNHSPASRALAAREVSREIEGNRQIMSDSLGNPVLLTRIHNRWAAEGEQDIGFAIAAVPVVTKESRTELGRDFTQIIVVQDTQQGPVLIQTPRGLQLMPLTSEHTGPYTHGYTGTGPSNLIAAVEGFLSWASNAELTAIGKDLVRSIIVGAAQNETILVSRENILRPGTISGNAGQ